MSILITSDPHWSENPRDAYRHKFVDWLLAQVKQLKVEQLFILGDLTEAKEGHSAELVNQIVEHIFRLSQLCEVKVLRGNHDYKGNPDAPFFEFLHRVNHTTWIGNPTKYHHKTLGKILFLPHTTDYKRDWKDIDFNQDWIFTHNTFTGATGDNGYQLEGVPIPKTKADIVSGDVHVPQKVGPVTYTGAPYTIDFGDSYKPRLLLIKNNKLHSLPCEGVQKRLVEVNSPTELAKQTHLNKGDILKIRMRIAAEDYSRWPEFKEKAHNWCLKRGYVPHAILATVDEPKKLARRKASRKTDAELVTTYGNSRGMDSKTIEIGQAIVQVT